MFNLFKKKFQDIFEYSDKWSVAQGVYEGKPMILRFRDIKDAIGHPDYPFQIGVVFPLKNPTPDGFPNQSESEILFSIETKFPDSLEKNKEAIFVMVITTKGMREFVFYAKEWKPEYFENKVKEINKSFPTHELQFMMKKDPAWDTFKQLVP